MTSPSSPPAARRQGTRLSGAERGAWRGFLRVHARLVADLEAELIAAHDLPIGHYEVLLTLHDAPDGRMRMAELADSVLLSRSGTTRLCDRLVREGLVERCASPDDARGLYAVITDAGRERFRAARATHLAGVRRHFTGRLSDEELTALAAIWDRVLPGAGD